MKTGFWITAGMMVALVAGCAEREVILPGKREDVRVSSDVSVISSQQANRILALTLPGPRNNTEWTQQIGTPATRTAHPALARDLTGVQWSADIGQGNSRRHRITADPVVAQGRVFAMDALSQVTALSTDGDMLWQTDLTPAQDNPTDAGGGGLAYGDGLLYVTSGFGALYALDPATGQEVWAQDLGAPTTAAPSVSRGLVYVVAGDNTAWALNSKTGRIAWQLSSVGDVSNVSGGPAPAVSDDLVIFASGSGELQAAFRRGGLRRWDAVVAGQRKGFAVNSISDITGDPIIVGNRVFAGSHQGRIVALNKDSGARLWTAKDGAVGPIWPAGGSLFAVTDRNELVRLDAATGERIWGTKLPLFVNEDRRRRVEIFAHYGPVVAGNRVIVASNDGQIRSFDPVSGDLVSTTELPGGAASDPVVAGSTLYVVSENGKLYALR